MHSNQSYRDKIIELINPVVEAELLELIEVECHKVESRWRVRIFIDKEGGVTIDNCAGISRQVGDLLDIYDLPPGSYTLEVSSPGIDRPLTREKDFLKFKGYKVKIRVGEQIDGRKNFCGKLVDFYEMQGKKILVVDVDGKIYQIPREAVVKANLESEF